MEATTAHRARRVAALVALGAILVLWLVRCSSQDPAPGEGAGTGGASGSVSVVDLTGSTSSLIVPGSSAPLDLRLTNSWSYAVSLTRLIVSIHAVDAPRSDAGHPCTPGDFKLRQAPPALTLRVPARASATLLELGTSRAQWPRVGMLNTSSNQDGCKGASVALDFRASASEALR
jgi:hypothetical protein